jgi:hypothetical protein
MLNPLLPRFVVIKVRKYSYEEFKEVALRVLEDELLGDTSTNNSRTICLYLESTLILAGRVRRSYG